MKHCGATMRRKYDVSAGFTIIELLVTIALIAILISLLLPAVQQAREAARRTQCRANLKQFGIAFQNYHSAHGIFPIGAGSTKNVCPLAGIEGVQERAPWTVLILPFIDQQSIYDRFDMNGSFAGLARNTSSTNQPVQFGIHSPPVFLCPSDENSFEFKSNYMGCAGGGDASQAWCVAVADSLRVFFNNGILHLNSGTRIVDCTDGASNTYLVGESVWMIGPPVPKDKWHSWATGMRYNDISFPGEWPSWNTLFSAVDPINFVNCTPATCYDNLMRTASSSHGAGCHMLFADGAVRFVNSTINLTVHRQLGSRSDGATNGGVE